VAGADPLTGLGSVLGNVGNVLGCIELFMNSLQPPDVEIAKWDRWFGVELNNQAWTLAEKSSRSAVEAEDMLHLAHAAALHWRRVGTEVHRVRADLLLGQVYALLGQGAQAMVYARRCYDFVSARPCPEWEVAFAHAVLAHAAQVVGDSELYERHYALAKALGEAIAAEEDREIFQRSFRQVPATD
jgi:hypothetical protein